MACSWRGRGPGRVGAGGRAAWGAGGRRQGEARRPLRSWGASPLRGRREGAGPIAGEALELAQTSAGGRPLGLGQIETLELILVEHVHRPIRQDQEVESQ